MKQEMKQLYEMQLNEKKRELDKLETKLRQAETQLENFKLSARLSIDDTPSTTRKPTTTSSNASSEILNTQLSLSDETDLAPVIPERPASTWRSSVLQTTSTPNNVQINTMYSGVGAAASVAHSSTVANRLSNDDYDIVSLHKYLDFNGLYCLNDRCDRSLIYAAISDKTRYFRMQSC